MFVELVVVRDVFNGFDREITPIKNCTVRVNLVTSVVYYADVVVITYVKHTAAGELIVVLDFISVQVGHEILGGTARFSPVNSQLKGNTQAEQMEIGGVQRMLIHNLHRCKV